MVKLLNQTIFASKIKEKTLLLFSVADVAMLFELSQPTAAKLVHRYTTRNFVTQIKRGLYALTDTIPSELFLANKLYEPSYLSREFALAFHDVIPEAVYELTSVTSKATRHFEKLGKKYSYRTIKSSAYTGYGIEKQGGTGFLIADPEKALVDASYFRMLDGLQPLSRVSEDKINPPQAFAYAELFDNKKLFEIIKTIIQ